LRPSTALAPKRVTPPAEFAATVFLFLAALVLAGTVAQQRLAHRSPGAEADVLAGTTLVPSEAEEGVTVTPGPGRLLLVESTPTGAQVLLDDLPLGETPYSSDFHCHADRPSVLELKKPGYSPARFTLKCADGSTRVSVTLKRAR
jgi:hypothetical protein